MQSSPSKFAILLNVYDLRKQMNDWISPLGLGLYHSGLEICGTEYTYSDSGIYSNPPRNAGPGATFRTQIKLGFVTMRFQQITKDVDSLRTRFAPGSYNLVTQNCNHFTNALCKRLLRKGIPGWVNRMAGLGSVCRCLLPAALAGAPDGRGSDSASPQSRYTAFSGRGLSLAGARRGDDRAFRAPAAATAGASTGELPSEKRSRLLQAALKRFGKDRSAGST